MIRLWIIPLETPNLPMDLEIRIAFQNDSGQKKKSERKTSISVYSRGYKNPGKIPCSFASFLHERGVARGNRVT